MKISAEIVNGKCPTCDEFTMLVGLTATKVAHVPVFHKTSIGRNPSKCKMNKSKRRSFKKYNGQGR
jgi:hypothetical protein